MKRYSMSLTVACLMMVIGAASCRDQTATPAAAPDEAVLPDAVDPDVMDPVSRIPQILEAVSEALQAGDADNALQQLEQAMLELPDGPDKGYLLSELLAIMVMHDQVDDARLRYLEALNTSPQAARRAYGTIENHLQQIDAIDELIAWNERLLAASPPADLLPVILRSHLMTLQRDGRHAAVITTLDVYTAQVSPDALASTVGLLARQLIADGLLEQADRLRAWLTADGRDDRVFQRESALLRTALIEARGQWDELPAAVRQAIPLLRSNEAAGRFDQWCRAALRAGRHDIVDDMTEAVLQDPDASAIALRAAHWRLVIPRERGDLDTALNRFESLSASLAPDQLPPLIGWISSVVFSEGTPEHARRYLVISETLPWSAMPDDERARHVGMLLDISFNASDFDRTLALLDEGVGGHDEQWHAVMRNKVLAHKAEQDGRLDEAVTRYRRFMDQMTDEDYEGLIDPVTGHRVTTSMVQALNARRIGNLLTAAERHDEAAAAFDEAVDQYHQAIEELGEDSAEGQWIREQLDAMGR